MTTRILQKTEHLFIQRALKLSFLHEGHPNGVIQKLGQQSFRFEAQPDDVCCNFLAVFQSEYYGSGMKGYSEGGMLLSIRDGTQQTLDAGTT